MTQASAKPFVFIGAGKTGRGFIARLAREENAAFAFVDKNETLVRRLRAERAYGISFFHGAREDLVIEGFEAYLPEERDAVTALAGAEGIFVSVGSGNFPEVAELLARAVRERRSQGTTTPCDLFTCENATKPALKLKTLVAAKCGAEERVHLEKHFGFSECTVFCSTIEREKTGLDILSEAYPELQYDAATVLRGTPPFRSMVPIRNFDAFLARKIYTYNCASAAIAYLGALKGYRMYAEAAQDEDVSAVLEALYREVEGALCAEYGYTVQDQREFARRSLEKFSDPAIEDTIERNARDVLRKLAPDDRLIGPARLMEKHGVKPLALALVVAGALCYKAQGETALREALAAKGAEGILRDTCGLDPASAFARRSLEYFKKLEAGSTGFRALLSEAR